MRNGKRLSRQLEFNNCETLDAIRFWKLVSEAFLERKVRLEEGRIELWQSCPSEDFQTMKQARSIAKALGIPLSCLYMDSLYLLEVPLPKTVNMRRISDVWESKV